jgi:hypothetical protein
MLRDPAFDRMFADAVAVLRPYLGDIVCIGGCANALYRHHELASSPVPEYLGTKDSDWALPARLAQRTEEPLAALMAKAGFVEEMHGTARAPVVKYTPKDGTVAADIEFLCPLSGVPGGRRRAVPAVEVQKGLMAQPLRYLEILSRNPWQVDLGRAPEFLRLKGTMVRIPNPAAYVLQKILIRDQGRRAESRAKDCYYMYEVSVVFRDNLAALGREYADLRDLPAPWIKRFEKGIRSLFRDEHSEGATSALDVREGAGIGGPSLSADLVQRAVAKMLDAMSVP